MKLLFIGEKQETVRHGWDQVNKRNQVVLEHLFETVDYLPLEYQSFQGKIYIGVTNSFLRKVDVALSRGYDYVFVCQSTCGRVCKFVRKKYPQTKIITFFHNIEKNYAKQFFKVSGIKAIPFFIRASIFEKMAVNKSDYCITLNRRDSDLLNQIYGKPADAVMPTSLEDKFKEKDSIISNNDEIIDYLFVGTAFYPNIEGVQWFIDNVMPKVNGRFTVVGKDMREAIFNNLNNRVSIYGFVDDLSDFYRRAKCVVSPIFHGGGMKTKTAEALMYGKLVLGTKEALEGYVIDSYSIIECNSSKDYVDTLSLFADSNKVYYQESRANFLRYCSYNSSEEVLSQLIK